jgi:hypothetical protein
VVVVVVVVVVGVEPAHGNGVRLSKLGLPTALTVLFKVELSAVRVADDWAFNKSLVFATREIGPDGVKSDVYNAVPLTMWKFVINPPK